MALKIASAWTAVIQFSMAILGTFILKRFPTSFSVGFFLGLVLIVAQQNLVLFGTFHNYAKFGWITAAARATETLAQAAHARWRANLCYRIYGTDVYT